MYEQVSHSLLNDILIRLNPEIKQQHIRHFYTRLGANFYAIYSLFHYLYGAREDFFDQALKLVETMARQYIARSDALKQTDLEREKRHNWFLGQEWVGMALYTDGFAGNLPGLRSRLHYFQELGVNLVHIMPILNCPGGRSDGGYAVSDFRSVDDRIGSNADLEALVEEMHKREILLILDVVVNHTSNEHEWAVRARRGERYYQDYYYIYPDRDIPDMFEQTMPEIFPETAPGNFTWDDQMQKWVMTVFNEFQWDLNYTNPAVFIEMLDVILFWANMGADIIRLDAVAFLWKKPGGSGQNEREAHLLLQLMKDCCQVTAPGVLFIAEAIVAPSEIIKYFGEDAINAKECEIAYNATFMALLWDAVATRDTRLMYQGLKSIPDKLERATWLNYLRCHDDIGLGIDDADITAVGFTPADHRRFLINYLTGNFPGSQARGIVFGYNSKTGDARISGTLASLAGLEAALDSGLPESIDLAIRQILLLHAMIMSFGGIPLLYYGDEIGTLNDSGYLQDPHKTGDSRWSHRPTIDWERVKRRHQTGTVENRVFTALRKMIAVRREIKAFADFNNRELIATANPHLFVFSRFSLERNAGGVLVAGNFDTRPQELDLVAVGRFSEPESGSLQDLYSGAKPDVVDGKLILPPFSFHWLGQ